MHYGIQPSRTTFNLAWHASALQLRQHLPWRNVSFICLLRIIVISISNILRHDWEILSPSLQLINGKKLSSNNQAILRANLHCQRRIYQWCKLWSFLSMRPTLQFSRRKVSVLRAWISWRGTWWDIVWLVFAVSNIYQSHKILNLTENHIRTFAL